MFSRPQGGDRVLLHPGTRPWGRRPRRSRQPEDGYGSRMALDDEELARLVELHEAGVADLLEAHDQLAAVYADAARWTYQAPIVVSGSTTSGA